MIEIYTKSDCPYCVMSKTWLKENKYEYIEHNLDNYETRQKFYDGFNIANRTVPQVFFNNRLIGGYFDLIKSELILNFNPEKEDF